MSLIEQAAKRLEELRRAGAEVPDAASADSGGSGFHGAASSACRRRKPRSAAWPRARRCRRRLRARHEPGSRCDRDIRRSDGREQTADRDRPRAR